MAIWRPMAISTAARPARNARSGTAVAMRAPIITPGTAPTSTDAASATSTRPAMEWPTVATDETTRACTRSVPMIVVALSG